MCVSLGLVIGVFPVLGSTTLLCAAIAFIAGLNQPAIQSVNYLVYPFQFLLLIPFYKAGAYLFHEPPVHVTALEVKGLIAAGVLAAIKALWSLTWHGIVVWVLCAPLVAALSYVILVPLLNALSRSSVPNEN